MATGSSNPWEGQFERLQEAYAEAIERNVEAQSEFVESWTRAVEDSVDEQLTAADADSFAAAYDVWMDAAEEAVERSAELAAGEEVEPEEFRDLWLDAANEAFKNVMGTGAFAAATGQALEEALDAQREAMAATEESLGGWGFATRGDVREIGDRLVELERRQHGVERKLDRILESLETERAAGEDR